VTVPIEMWILFGAMVTAALFVDLWKQRDASHIHAISMKEALTWTGVWIFLALGFASVIYFRMGSVKSVEFLAAYVIEESLSVDNMFVFVLIFSFFKVSARYQPRILLYGILGAIGMRFVVIFAGVALLQRFHWVLYVFGAVLLITAFRMMFEGEKNMNPEKNPLLKMFQKFMPFTNRFHEEHFFVRENAKWLATPLFATLLVIEASDLLFAVDSIPAVLAISQDIFIVFTSNIFAILGLRSLYFLVHGSMELFSHLKYGLALVLMFIGSKMLLMDIYPIHTGFSLAVIAVILATSILTSITFPQKK
jgi:tellurite resistance protein TerC